MVGDGTDVLYPASPICSNSRVAYAFSTRTARHDPDYSRGRPLLAADPSLHYRRGSAVAHTKSPYRADPAPASGIDAYPRTDCPSSLCCPYEQQERDRYPR